MNSKNMLRSISAGQMTVGIYKTRDDMGYAAAADTCEALKSFLSKKPEVNVIFPCAMSQLDFFKYLFSMPGIEWERVNAFIMDEYMGLSPDSPQALINFANENIFGKVNFKNNFAFNAANPDFDDECRRFSDLLEKHPLDIACLGIGENGHLAYNEPHVADFFDPKLAKIVYIDEKSRNQAVHDGVFQSVDDVPKAAITVTIPAMLRAEYLSTVVPTKYKQNAVKDTVCGEISTRCPASILRVKPSFLYVDSDAGAML
jgi:glucosamine-6-phosphate deaminase